MEKYSNMVMRNHKSSEEKINRAIVEINKMIREEKQVVVCELVKRTGLSRAFFYNNDSVKKELKKAQDLQDGKDFTRPQKVIFDHAMEKQIERLKKDNSEKDVTIEKMQKEIARLKHALNRQALKTIKSL